MTQKEKNQIKIQIQTDLKLLKKQIKALEEKTKPIAPDCSLGR